jgi:rhodanese-related sulfurtransferase
LFLGDVGRPDLAQSTNVTQEDLAGILFESLRNKIMTLPDEVIVYPGHGAGSSCGKSMSKETVGSIGHEKATNYALRSNMTKQEFIQEVTDGMLAPPVYFSENVRLNKQGYATVNKNIEKANISLSVEDFKEKSLEEGVVILDVRSEENFVKGFISNSIFIGIDGGFAPWVGALIKHVETPILLVCESDRLEEVAIRLSRVGFDNILGHLKGGVSSWKKDDLATISSISSEEFSAIYQANNQIDIVDVRKETEYQTRHIIDAKLAPLSMLEIHGSTFVNDKQNYVHCAGGYRSVIACSLLRRVGINNTINIEGGFDAIKKTAINLSAEDCPSIL